MESERYSSLKKIPTSSLFLLALVFCFIRLFMTFTVMSDRFGLKAVKESEEYTLNYDAINPSLNVSATIPPHSPPGGLTGASGELISQNMDPIHDANLRKGCSGCKEASSIFQRLNSVASDKGGECYRLFGKGYLDSWKENKEVLCDGGGGFSKFTCYTSGKDTRANRMCVGNDVYINSAAIADVDGETSWFFDLPANASGALDCEMKESFASRKTWNTDYATSSQWITGLKFDKNMSSLQEKCKTWIDHPVMLWSRYDTWNSYHMTEDFFQAYMHLLLLEEQLDDDIQVVFYGKRSANTPQTAGWEALLGSGKYPVLWWGKKAAFPEGSCFRNVVFNAFAVASVLSYKGAQSAYNCESTLFQGYVEYALKKLKIADKPLSRSHIRIGALYRPPMKSESSWQRSRFLKNIFKEAGELQQQLNEEYGQKGFYISVTAFQYEQFDTFVEQVEFTRNLHFLVGMHGAGLSNMQYMQKGSHVLEMKVAGDKYTHYENFSLFLGNRVKHEYLRDVSTNLPVRTIASKVGEYLNKLRPPTKVYTSIEN